MALDCGANVGKITLDLAKTGATVYAFEPNPYAFPELREAVADFANVICFEKAVSDADGTVKLYMHERAPEDPVRWSTGSSILPFKGNVDAGRFVEVPCVDLCRFIRGLDQPVELIKMDVEGAECPILKKMIETGLVGNVGRIFCEMHDAKIPELVGPSNEIRGLVRDRKLDHVDLNWV